MQFNFKLPDDTLVVKRTDLKEVLEEMLVDIQEKDGTNDIMTIKQTAEYLKVSVPTVRIMIANREIPFFQRGQVIRLNRKDVKEWLRINSNTSRERNF